MATKINYNVFMSHMTILHSHTATNFIDGLKFYVINEGTMDMVTYNNTDKFLLFSAGPLLKDVGDNYYFEYTPKREWVDIMDNITIKHVNKNIMISYYIGGTKYDPQVIKEFVFVAAMYNEFKIRFTFLEIPAENYEFTICSRNYILKNSLRDYLRDNKLITDSMIYYEGMCIGNNKLKIVFYEPNEIMLIENSKIAHLQKTKMTESELLLKYDIDYDSFYRNKICHEKRGVINLKSAREVHIFLLDYMND